MIRAVSANGAVIEGMDYGAFGERRGYIDPTLPAAVPQTTTRGFTGHEMIDGTDVVHMNGRIYDSKLGRFLQADPVIQEPNNPQNFNRYTYVLNNPLSLTDPSGFSFLGKLTKFIRPLVAIAITYYTAGLAAAAAGWASAGWTVAGGFAAGVVSSGTLKGGLIGAFTAGVGFGITKIPGIDNFGNAFFQGALNGGVSAASGGNFGHAFASAGFSAYAGGSDFSQGLKSFESQVAVSAIIGGTASELSGGKFANGAVTGAMQGALRSIRDSSAVSFDQSSESFDAGPDGDFTKRRGIFDKIVELRDQLEISIPDGVSIVYDDRFAYLDDNNVFQTCSANCQDVIDQRGAITGSFDKKTITLFRGAVESGRFFVESVVDNGIVIRGFKVSGLERAAKTLGHEAAHARGIDRNLSGSVFHPNAERAGQRALDILRKKSL